MSDSLLPSDVAKYPFSQRRKAYDRMIKSGRQDSLGLRISSKVALTSEEVDAAMGVLCFRAWQTTKAQVLAALQNVPNIPSYGMYERLLFHDGVQVCSYCAGQDYPYEITVVRDLLRGKT